MFCLQSAENMSEIRNSKSFSRKISLGLCFLVAIYIFWTRSLKFIQTRSCKDPFFLPVKYSEFDPKCTIPKPKGYLTSLIGPAALWTVRLSNLGTLDKEDKYFNLHTRHQRWARINEKENLMHLNPKGGTAARAFKDTYEYSKIITALENKIIYCRTRENSSLLDMGSGTGSLAAVFKSILGNRSGVSVFSYVLPDRYLRLSVIHAERGIQTMLHNYKGKPLPFPSQSFRFVHCRFCWHHLVGYDKWLTEVNRLLLPGGYFIFTFVPKRDEELLPQAKWQNALRKQPWSCSYSHRIVQICLKNSEKTPQLKEVCKREIDDTKFVTHHKIWKLHSPYRDAVQEIRNRGYPNVTYLRALNVNCESSYFCFFLPKWFPKWTITSTYKSNDNGILRKAIKSGYQSFEHDWKVPGPFYPRTFDLVNLIFGEESNLSLKISKKNIFLELNRLLQPHGFMIIVKENSFSSEDLRVSMQQAYFEVVVEKKNFVIAKKLDIFNSRNSSATEV